ncbi:MULTISPECIES: PAS domain-containing sensor histidine kinase [Clostridium]|uniref:PAS domain-containing sensor histidine kinase n=1 Tax=Clostridium TaxID=1485 RepID=UPI001899F0DB|nr:MULTISPECIES: PAS domain-containing sensor histidine kinase [Clostridium]MDI9217648.1 PAS domain-containing sensor histidine kinase [Clostridium tertium]
MEEFLNILQDYILVIEDSKIKFHNKALKDLLGHNLEMLELIKEQAKSNRYITINDKYNNKITVEPIIKDITIDGTELRLITLKELKNKSYNIFDLELILDNIPVSAWAKDIDGKYVYTNRRYAELLKLDKSQIIGKDDTHFWNMYQSNICRNEDLRIIENKGYFVDKQKVSIRNEDVWFNIIKFAILDECEKVKIIIGLADNITDEVTLSEKKKLLEHEIQMETLKNEFFTNISHEFKTPLNVIITANKLIKTYLENEFKENLNDIILKKYVTSIEKNSFRLERLVNNLIDITKIDSGDYKISMHNYNIISVIENVVLAVIDYISSEDISIIFDTSEEEKFVKCNKDSIERIVLNLLSNSIKNINGKGNILVNINAYEDCVDITVKDNGQGIPQEYIENIFNKFGQADKGLSRKHEGSGLGLFIVKSLVEMHGGAISIESEVGLGTEVTIRLYSNEIENGEEINEELGDLINKCDKEFSDIYNI